MAASPTYAHGLLAVAVIDAANGQVLFEHNAQRSAAPASVMKLVSSANAMHYLGPEHRFSTRLETTAPVAGDGVLQGDLVIRGGGDPSLGSDRVAGSAKFPALLQSWSDAVRQAGIRSIRGAVVADDSWLPNDPLPDDWTWSDIGNYYGAGTSGLCFHDNLYALFFKPGNSVGDPAAIARTEPPTPEIEWTNLMRTGPAGSGDQGYIYGVAGTTRRTTRGTIPLGAEFSIRGSLPDPAATAARMFREKLEGDGLQVAGGWRATRGDAISSAGARLICETKSPPLRDIVFKLNKQSFNLYAEMMLMHVARKAGDGSRQAGLQAEMDYLKKLGVDLGGVSLKDGSGLSRSNCLTARALAQMLRALRAEPFFKPWSHSIAVIGVDGDLAGLAKGTPLAGRVRAKTGYINAVRSLAGYIDAKSGRTLCFAFLANDFDGGRTAVDRDFVRMLTAFADEY